MIAKRKPQLDVKAEMIGILKNCRRGDRDDSYVKNCGCGDRNKWKTVDVETETSGKLWTWRQKQVENCGRGDRDDSYVKNCGCGDRNKWKTVDVEAV